jgi:hypothetical protein
VTVGTPMRTAQHVHMHVRIVRGRSRPPRARLCGIGDKKGWDARAVDRVRSRIGDQQVQP